MRILMKTTLRLLVFLCFVMAITQARAEARAPQLVITDFVKALQMNDVEHLKKHVALERIKEQPRHSYTIKQLKALFADVDASSIAFSKPAYEKTRKIIRIRMTKPLSFDFELQHQNAVNGKGDFYRIIGIHP